MAKKRRPSRLARKQHGKVILAEFTESLGSNEAALEDMEKTLPNHISFICRSWIIHLLTSYEYLLNSFIYSKDDTKQFKLVTAPNQYNEDRLKKLKEVLSKYGFVPADDIFEDFNALISLRNYIVHGRWSSDEQKEVVKNSQFPTNINKLNKIHLKRIKHIGAIIIQSLFNSILITASKYDKKGLDKILISIGIDPEIYNNATFSEMHKLLFIHLGMPEEVYDSCLRDKNTIDSEKLEIALQNTPNFNWDKLAELHKHNVKNIKWPS